MNILAISDLHGLLPQLPSFDLLIIAGDISPTTAHKQDYQKDWLNREFMYWIRNLKYNNEFSKVILIGGNHDNYLSKCNPEEIRDHLFVNSNKRLVYLYDSLYNFEYMDVNNNLQTISIYGTPWTPTFGRWHFMQNEEELKKIYSKIPQNIDILVNHGMPYMTNDIAFDFHRGSTSLADAIVCKEPKVFIGGHLHDPLNNKPDTFAKTTVYNVASVDESYTLKEKYYTKISL